MYYLDLDHLVKRRVLMSGKKKPPLISAMKSLPSAFLEQKHSWMILYSLFWN